MKKRYLVLATIIFLSANLTTSATIAQEADQYFFQVYLMSPDMFDVRQAEIIVTELAKIGIKVEVEAGDFGVWIDRCGKVPLTHKDGGFDMSLMWWGWGTDPDLLYGVFHTSSVRPFGWNIFDFSNGKADIALQEGRTNMTFAGRQQAYWDFLEVIQDELPMDIITWRINNPVLAANLHTYDAYVAGGLDWSETYYYDPPIKDTLVWAFSSDHKHMNPLFSMEGGSNQFISLVFDGLVRIDKDKQVVPHLAESWTTSEDLLTYTFKLHDNVYWHDGEKLTAKDVEFTYNAVNIPEVGSVWAGPLEPVEYVKALDDYTVELKFKQPHGPGITQVAILQIVPEHILGSVPYEAWQTHSFSTEHPIGTGPYKFMEWSPDEFTRLEANEEYFRGAPSIPNFYYKVIPDKATALVALENGELDFASYAFDWSVDEYEHIKTIPTLKIESYSGLGTGFTLCHNLAHPNLANKYVRQAISFALPRERICNDILGTHSQKPANQIVPPDWPWYNPNIPFRDYDIEKAKELMELAGYHYDYITPEPAAPWTANLMPITTGVVIGLVIGVAGTWIVKKK